MLVKMEIAGYLGHSLSGGGGGQLDGPTPRRLIYPNGFRNALGDFPGSMMGVPVIALVSLWH